MLRYRSLCLSRRSRFASTHLILNCAHVFFLAMSSYTFPSRSTARRSSTVSRARVLRGAIALDIPCCRRQPCAIVARSLLSRRGNTTRSHTSPITYRSNTREPTISFRRPHYRQLKYVRYERKIVDSRVTWSPRFLLCFHSRIRNKTLCTSAPMPASRGFDRRRWCIESAFYPS